MHCTIINNDIVTVLPAGTC